MKYFLIFVCMIIIKYCDCKAVEENCKQQFEHVISLYTTLKVDSGKLDSLYLLENNNHSIEFNKKFVSMLTHYHVYKIPPFCPNNDVLATIIAAKKFGINVINLAVLEADFDEEVLKSEDLIVVDYFDQINGEIAVCANTKTVKRDIDSENETTTVIVNSITDNNEDNTCVSQTVEGKIGASKIFSKSIEYHPTLYHIIVHFSEKTEASKFDTIPYLSVILCIDMHEYNESDIDILKNYSSPSVIIIVEKCKNIADYSKQNILAALAPKPLQYEDGTEIPVMFYESIQLLPEHKMIYPNSMTLHPNHIETLRYGIIEYSKKNKWNRVAVVLDDSPNSEKFEENLHELFNKYNILNTIKSCMEKHCNFNKVLMNLKEAEAKIIIANIDVKYANNLVTIANKLNMTSSYGFIWIWRDWPFETDLATRPMGDVYSIFLTPNYEYEQFDDTTQLRIGNVIGAMKIMNKIHKKVVNHKSRVKSVFVETFYRNIYREIEVSLATEKNIFQVRKISATNKTIICTFLVTHPLTEESFKLKKRTSTPIYLKSQCMSPTLNFYEPCDDPYLIIEMLVLLVFLITGLAIYIFFDYMKNNRYTHF